MGDQDQDRFIHLKELSVTFVKRTSAKRDGRLNAFWAFEAPTSVLELIFKDDAGVKLKSNKLKEGDLLHWSLDTVVKANSSALLLIRRAPFNMSVAEIVIEFRPNVFGDHRAVTLEDSNHRVTLNFVCGGSKSVGPQLFSEALQRVIELLP
ncbi:hypothetical protein V8E53_007490 [Lactarius tabidus]